MKCTDCRIPIPHGENCSRSISFKRVDLCRPCAEDRGWIDPSRPVLTLVSA